MSALIRFSINSLLISKHFSTKLNGFQKPVNLLMVTRSRYSTQSTPKYGTVKMDESNKTNELDDKWTIIYRYKYIIPVKAFCRLKLFQTLFLTAVTPLSINAYSNDLINLIDCQTFIGLNVFACITLYIFGNLFQKVVGIVYVNEELTKTRIAHLTFWGRRQDTIHNINDLAPLPDFNEINDLFCKVRSTTDDKVLYYLSLKHGTIDEPEKFYKAFGTHGLE